MGDTCTTTADIAASPNKSRVKSAATTNATLLKANKGNIYGWDLRGTTITAVSAFVKFYDKASAPVVGTDVPVFTIPIVSSTTAPGMDEYMIDVGIPFTNGIAYAITALVADTDTTAVALDQVHGFILWK